MCLSSGRDHLLRCRLDYMSCWDMEVGSCLSRYLDALLFSRNVLSFMTVLFILKWFAPSLFSRMTMASLTLTKKRWSTRRLENRWVELCFLVVRSPGPKTLTPSPDLPGVHVVSRQRNVGQQILHHRFLLRRMPRWVCGTLPVSQQRGARVGCTINTRLPGEFDAILEENHPGKWLI